MAQIIIANRLRDGAVVFLGPDAGWVESIDESRVVGADADAETALAQAKADEAACIVIDPYLIDVDTVGGRLKPTVYREEIRAFGPSVRTERIDASTPTT